MSGTSCDGIDAALVRVDDGPSPTLIDFLYTPYDEDLRSVLVQMPRDPIELAHIHMLLGERFSAAVNELRAKHTDVHIDAIGCHGHTVAHAPPDAYGLGATIQLGAAAVIAERTGIAVINDFRTRDMAVGGHGAPLVPFADSILFRDDSLHTVSLNIGGIANCSVVRPEGSIAIAFDTGPGNMIIDAIVQRYGDDTIDQDGALAARGEIDNALRDALLNHPYFGMTPPKSTGREEFGFDSYLMPCEEPLRSMKIEDAAATMTAVVARSIAHGITQHAINDENARVVVSGGGAYNPTLLGMLQNELGSIPLLRSDDLGWPADAKEAVAFALLGDAYLRGVPGNVPAATGARKSVVLGTFTPGS